MILFDAEYTDDSSSGIVRSSNPFSDKEVRRGFIRKVFLILSVQFFINGLIIAAFLFIMSSFVLLLGMVCCCQDVLTKVPQNYILLFLYTTLEGISLGAISAHYKIDHVLIAIGITTTITVALSIFALQTKVDFTMYTGVLFVILIVLFMFGILLSFMGTSRIMTLVYSSLAALLFSAYLVVDVQRLSSGKQQSISPEHYILAALSIYIDVINIFINILQIVSQMDN
ncbi:hypothetical protein BaRGS_00020945 [Batillaria attramentaria]|uniref:Uncharacterized protein n=1 Tax=Batillaria attramentaria TaxID=370345 RepID=A0ABD0KL20_9CAEN